jgi:phospholipase/carboxylesterase
VAAGRLPDRIAPHHTVSWDIPRQQLSDTASASLQQRQLLAFARQLPGVSVAESRIAVTGTQAFTLDDEPGEGDDAFLVPSVGEFARLHSWAGTRLSPGFVMVCGPRDDAEPIPAQQGAVLDALGDAGLRRSR